MGNTLKAADLYRILSDAKLFAGTDKLIPSLIRVQLEFSDGRVLAKATNRYQLGIARADYTGEAFTLGLPTPAVDMVLKLAKTAKRDSGWRMAELDYSVETTTLTVTFTDGQSVAVQTVPAEDVELFPNITRLIPAQHALTERGGEQCSIASLDAAQFAKFAKVSGDAALRLGWTSPAVTRYINRPIVVRKGEDFIGLQMPTRIDDHLIDSIIPDWLS